MSFQQITLPSWTEYFLNLSLRVIPMLIVDGIRANREEEKYDRMLRDREEQYQRQVRDHLQREHFKQRERALFRERDTRMELMTQLAWMKEGEQFLNTACGEFLWQDHYDTVILRREYERQEEGHL